MSQTIVNLTLPIVVEKINHVLNHASPWSERLTPAVPELRQKLTAYVLSRLPVVYVTMESEAACSMDNPTYCYSHEQQARIDQLIQQGLALLLEHQHLWQPHLDPAELVESGNSPSNWFG
jgi:hypothetical protein